MGKIKLIITNNNKMEPNTQSLQVTVKSRFFAQYWGQEVLIFKNKGGVYKINPPNVWGEGVTNQLIEGYLRLKSPSNYTDEDAIAVEKIWRSSDERVEAYFLNSYPNTKFDDTKLIGRSLIKHWLERDKLNFRNRIDYRTIQHITEYLRSKGYAVAFMEYSVDDLVSFGWVQLV